MSGGSSSRVSGGGGGSSRISSGAGPRINSGTGAYRGSSGTGGASHMKSGGQLKSHSGGTVNSTIRSGAGKAGHSAGGQHANWNTHHGNWNNSSGRHHWDNYFHHDYHRGWGWGWGPYWPWYVGWGVSLGWGGWGYPYAYNYYDPGNYYYCYSEAPYAAAAPAAAVDAGVAQAAAETQTPVAADGQQDDSEALQYYSEARAAFQQGDYRNALRLASHSAVEAPQNPRTHELISLALFASGNYRGAASEAHAALALGPITDWNGLYGYYNDVEKYTSHVRALEKAVSDNPKSAAEHFLLGYHYLMTGARDNAKAQFAEAVKLTPDDKLAAHYLKQLQSNSPITPPAPEPKPEGKLL